MASSPRHILVVRACPLMIARYSCIVCVGQQARSQQGHLVRVGTSNQEAATTTTAVHHMAKTLCFQFDKVARWMPPLWHSPCSGLEHGMLAAHSTSAEQYP
mmetsp:Transcript_45123/g.116722  ORF Transcript_45123/g.116722 Transcript_45123/m.116722 type:complete len:101 (-) Transcript_45123:1851-2153(-)